MCLLRDLLLRVIARLGLGRFLLLAGLLKRRRGLRKRCIDGLTEVDTCVLFERIVWLALHGPALRGIRTQSYPVDSIQTAGLGLRGY